MKKPSNKFSVDNAGQDFVAGIYRQDGLSTGDPVNRKKGGKVAKKNMSMKGRRDVSKATRKPKGTYGFS